MAAVQNLEVIVDVDISKALAKLTDLQDELRQVAQEIETVDAVGADGIDVRTNVDDLDTELAALAAEIELFERTQEISVPVRFDQSQFGQLRGLMRDSFGDALRETNFGVVGGSGGLGGGGGRVGFGSEFLAPGTRGAARMSDISAGMGRLFGDRTRTQRIFENLSDIVDDAAQSLKDMKLNMSTLHNLLASLIPLIFVFIGAIPTAINALLALATAALAAAGAFAVIAGLGALGAATAEAGGMPSMDDFSQFWEDIRDSFFESFAPLAERLAPVFRDALDGLEMFFMAIASQGDALVELVDEARAFGRFMTNFIPAVLRELAAMVEGLEPIFAEIGEWLLEDSQIIRTMTQLTLEAIPALRSLAATFAAALPGLIRFSTGMAQVADVVLSAIGGLISLASLLGISNEALGIIIGSLLTFATLLALSAFLASSKLGVALAMLVKTIFTKFLVAVVAAQGGLASMGLAAMLASIAVATLLSILTLGAFAVVAAGIFSLTTEFFGLAEGIDAATGSMKDFNRVSGRGGTGGMNPYGPGSGAGGGPAPPPSGGTTVNMERTGDRDTDKSDGNKMAWRLGRTSGKRP